MDSTGSRLFCETCNKVFEDPSKLGRHQSMHKRKASGRFSVEFVLKHSFPLWLYMTTVISIVERRHILAIPATDPFHSYEISRYILARNDISAICVPRIVYF